MTSIITTSLFSDFKQIKKYFKAYDQASQGLKVMCWNFSNCLLDFFLYKMMKTWEINKTLHILNVSLLG